MNASDSARQLAYAIAAAAINDALQTAEQTRINGLYVLAAMFAASYTLLRKNGLTRENITNGLDTADRVDRPSDITPIDKSRLN
jgi:hypothetical protein